MMKRTIDFPARPVAILRRYPSPGKEPMAPADHHASIILEILGEFDSSGPLSVQFDTQCGFEAGGQPERIISLYPETVGSRLIP
jgi:hypothetical protein